MLVRQPTEYYVYQLVNNQKVFVATIITDSPHKAKQLVWSKFEPEIKLKNSDAKINHLVVDTINKVMTK